MDDKQRYTKHLWASLEQAIRDGDIDKAVGYAKGIADNEAPAFANKGKRAMIIFIMAVEQVIR